MPKILVVEDHLRLGKNIEEFLRLEKFDVVHVRDGLSAVKTAEEGDVRLIILDLNLPVIDGMEVCRRIRASRNDVPILMLTSRGEIEDRVEGLNLGADDFLTKPFAFEELLARVRALLRRKASEKSEIVRCGKCSVNFTTREIISEGRSISLSPKEFAVFEYLFRNRGRIRSRTEILDSVWGSSDEERLFHSDTVEVHIAVLRRKLGKNVIQTVRGAGYMVPEIFPEE